MRICRRPQDLTPGTYTYHFRAIENAYPSGEIDGPWEAFTFIIVAPNPPVVDNLSLANVTGPGTSPSGRSPSGPARASRRSQVPL